MRLPVGVECEAATIRHFYLDLSVGKMLKAGGLQLESVLESVFCQGVLDQTVFTAADAELPVNFANGLGSTEHAPIEPCQPELVSSRDPTVRRCAPQIKLHFTYTVARLRWLKQTLEPDREGSCVSRGLGTTPEYLTHCESVLVQICYRSRLAEL